jgi:hypothetical protein
MSQKTLIFVCSDYLAGKKGRIGGTYNWNLFTALPWQHRWHSCALDLGSIMADICVQQCSQLDGLPVWMTWCWWWWWLCTRWWIHANNTKGTSRDPLLLDFQSYNNIINAKHYCQTLQNLHTNNKNKPLCKCPHSIILLHSAYPHVAPDIKCRTNWMPCDGRCPNILLTHTAQA